MPLQPAGAVTHEAVSIGKTVEIRFADGMVDTYRVEYRPYDMLELAASSPLGEALLGHFAGERVEYRAPQGTVRLQIVSVR
jgi:transcription elongation factor GreA